MTGDIRVSQRYRAARRDSGLVVLEGFHAIKHALRFRAVILDVVGTDLAEVERLAGDLAPDVRDALMEAVVEVKQETLASLAPQAPRTGIMGIARRPDIRPELVLRDASVGPIVLLEDPRNLANMGACVRVAAAADIGGVFTTGTNDPWHPDAVRGAAGLHFALPVARIKTLPDTDRPLVAVDPEGDLFEPAELPSRAVLAFGTERYGLSDALLSQADARLAIPMRTGVSSLNLATSVAAVLYAWRLSVPSVRR